MKVMSQYIPPEKILPDITLCRYFDTRYAPTGKNRQREALCYELSFYFEGDGSIIINGMENKIHAGDIRFSAPGDILCSVPNYKCYTIYFDIGKNGQLCTNAVISAFPNYFHASNSYKEDFASFITVFRNGGASSGMKLNAMLLSMICKLYDQIISGRKLSKCVKACIEHLETNFSRQVSLEELGRLCGYSPLHVLRLFKQELGYSPHQYLTELRINAAKDLLINTDTPLDLVSKNCGFSSESHFNGLFKNKTGFTPGSFRRYSF